MVNTETGWEPGGRMGRRGGKGWVWRAVGMTEGGSVSSPTYNPYSQMLLSKVSLPEF